MSPHRHTLYVTVGLFSSFTEEETEVHGKYLTWAIQKTAEAEFASEYSAIWMEAKCTLLPVALCAELDWVLTGCVVVHV